MYLVSLHGHATSFSPSASGAPTEWRAGTNLALTSSIRRSTLVPIRAITVIDATTYAESVISTPNIGLSASMWPITKGMTYIVRPCIDPRYRSRMTTFLSSGAIQLVVGPASLSSNVPDATRALVSSTHSSSDPVHQWILAGWVSSATSATQSRIPWWAVGALWLLDVALTDAVSAVMAYRSLSRIRGGFHAPGRRTYSMVCRGVS